MALSIEDKLSKEDDEAYNQYVNIRAFKTFIKELKKELASEDYISASGDNIIIEITQVDRIIKKFAGDRHNRKV